MYAKKILYAYNQSTHPQTTKQSARQEQVASFDAQPECPQGSYICKAITNEAWCLY
jgi:hypothetical protein